MSHVTEPETLLEENARLKEQVATLWKSKIVKMPPSSFLWIKGPMPMPLAKKIQQLMVSHGLHNMIILTTDEVELRELTDENLEKLGLARVK